MVKKIKYDTLIEEMRVYNETLSIFCHSFPISDLVQGIFEDPLCLHVLSTVYVVRAFMYAS